MRRQRAAAEQAAAERQRVTLAAVQQQRRAHHAALRTRIDEARAQLATQDVSGCKADNQNLKGRACHLIMGRLQDRQRCRLPESGIQLVLAEQEYMQATYSLETAS